MIDPKTFISILITVTTIVTWFWKVVNTQNEMIIKMDTIISRIDKQDSKIDDIVTKRDISHREYDMKLARLEPTVEMIIKKIGL